MWKKPTRSVQNEPSEDACGRLTFSKVPEIYEHS